MSDTLRLFFALPFPAEAVSEVLRIQHELRAQSPEAAELLRFTRSADLHVTLKFLGSCPPAHVSLLVDALHHVTDGVVLAETQSGALTAFPSTKRARVVVLGIHESSGVLVNVAQQLEQRCAALGYAPERRPFVPHLTVARCRMPVNVSTWVSAVTPVRKQLQFQRLQLINSNLKPTGPRYEVLAEAPLHS